ncbi:MAG: SdpA family antimicrobial peptide system protein [Kofleriaceae bacterium]
MSAVVAPSARALGALTLALAAAWLVVIGYAAYPALPQSPVRLPLAERAHSYLWAPQGWSFFTRDPRGDRQFVYHKGASGWDPVLLAPHGRLTNLAGLRRRSRAQGVEMALLLENVPPTAWRTCDAPVQVCLSQPSTPREVPNVSPDPTMCGDVAVVLQRPLPWAWARASRPITMPSRVVSLRVSC